MAKFWTFRQNNSGGIFYVNDVVAANVIIEADFLEAAKKLFWELDPPQEYCECCGERWDSVDYIGVDDATDEPKIFTFVGGRYDYVSPEDERLRKADRDDSTIVYYADGSIYQNYELKELGRD